MAATLSQSAPVLLPQDHEWHICTPIEATNVNLIAGVCLQINQQKGADGLPEIRKAFEFTVEKMGTDIASGPLWQEYIAFLEVRHCEVQAGCRAA